MEKILTGNEYIINDASFDRLLAEETDGIDGNVRKVLDREKALALLREDNALAAKLLASSSREMVYLGEHSRTRGDLDGVMGTLGMRMDRGSDSPLFVGDNLAGKFLASLARQLREEMAESEVQDRGVRESRIMVDWTPFGEYISDVAYSEEEGRKYIHVDRYIPKRFTFDANRSGSTGHAERRSAEDVSFHSYVCPFGVDSRSEIVVESAAEASLLYEKAIRGEVDWKKLVSDMRAEGRVRGISNSNELDRFVSDKRAQFEWVREQIAQHSDELSRLPIVASSLVVPDQSMGRSIYDAEHAPSPAHVLEHYIHNPQLLSGISESYVYRALEKEEKNEPTHFNVGEGSKMLTVVVAGSDTIGGRVPGTRATQSSVVSYTRDKATGALKDNGKVKTAKVEFKSEQEVEEDYRSFSARLDSVLSSVDTEVSVRFVVAKSTVSGGKAHRTGGMGTPKMVERYVKEHGGRNLDYDLVRGVTVNRGEVKGGDRLQSVALQHFDECWPVLVGYLDSVNVRLNEMDDESVKRFGSESGLVGDAAMLFSIGADNWNRDILEKGSLAVSSDIPVVHVQENMTEEAQLQSLRSGSILSLSEEGMEDSFSESIFSGKERSQWNIDGSESVVSSMDNGGTTIPSVMLDNAVSVSVGAMSYKTVFGAFVALLSAEGGHPDAVMLRRISLAESDHELSSRLVSLLGVYRDASKGVDSAAEERCMRKAVRLFTRADLSFADRLVSFEGKDIVEVSGIQAGKLFADMQGMGGNRFGAVLSHEAGIVASQREALRQQAEELQRQAIEDAVRAQKRREAQRAEGQKVVGGLPSRADSADAVWFTGTSKPAGLLLEDGVKSFQEWEKYDEMGNKDPLCREKAQRQFLTDEDGDRFDNGYVYLSPSCLTVATGRKRPSMKPTSADLTDCMRVDQETGKEYVCGFGIPVIHDWERNEPGNSQGMPSSYRLDNENAAFRNSVILADTQARSVALQHGLALCAEVDNVYGGYSISREFRSKVYMTPKNDGSLVDPKTGKKVYLQRTVEVSREGDYNAVVHEKSSGAAIRRALDSRNKMSETKSKPVMMKNPHAAPLNEATVERYMDVLKNGADLPLNCIPLPSDDYTFDIGREGSREEAERRFKVDFNLSLEMANSLAIALDKPLRFPLDGNGRLDLGPNVPEEFRAIAEQNVDAFLGIRKDNALDGPLPSVDRITMYEASTSCKHSTGKYEFFRPSDLVYAFGQYDFRGVEYSSVPMHEMAFRFDDGSSLKLTDPRLSGRLDPDDVKGYVNYTKNDERKFSVRTSDPEKADWQLSVIKSYIERAKAIKVEAALFEEGCIETRNLDLEGYIDLKSSNTLEHASNEWEIEGREQKPWETVGRFNGKEKEEVYDGHVDAGDGFKGYAMMRHILPDGTQSSWRVITDRELAKQIVFSNVNRVYRSDEFVPASKHVIDMMLTAEAVKADGHRFRTMEFQGIRQKPSDDKVVEIARTVSLKETKAQPAESVNVFAGRGENEALSNFARRRFKIDINKYIRRH